ncbi:hypothetical protein L9F63_001189, partial [Diploptera punctata]
LLLALLSSCFPSIYFGHRPSSILKTCPNHFNSFSSILSIMLSSASIMFLIFLFVTCSNFDFLTLLLYS